MNKSNLSRRGFMQRSLAAMAAAGVPAWYAQDLFAMQQQQPQNAKEQILLGAIGIGSPQSRNRQLVGETRKDANVKYVAVCDVDSRHLDNAARGFQNEVKKYGDFRELLDNKEVQAVTIAVPDHWHALIAIEALKKGKHVYCEKPLSLTIAEGRAIVKAANKSGRIFQTGSQQRSEFNGRFRQIVQLVRNGRVGKIKTVETVVDGNPTSPSIPKVAVPQGLNWEFWLGPAPKADYVETPQGNQKKCRHPYEFRWWYDYSGGKMTDWGAHHNDIAQWGLAMDESGPVAVEAEGQKPSGEPNSYTTHPSFKITYTYANGVKLTCGSRLTGMGNGINFTGEDGRWIFASRNTLNASDPKLISEALPSDAWKPYPSSNHMANFFDCVRNNKPTICPAEIGHRSVSVCHMGTIALRLGKKLKWDPVKEEFDDAEANKMLSREYTKPWKLEV